MTGRRTKTVVAAMVLTAAIAEGAAAQAPPPTLGGGRLPTAASPRTYTPTVNLSLQPRGARIAMLFDSTVLCGRDVLDVSGSGDVPFDGSNFSFRGASAQRLASGRLAVEWTVNGRLSGSSATGTLQVVGARRRSGRTRKCARKPSRPFEVRFAGPPAGGPAQAVPRGFYAGTSSYEIFDRMQAPVILRASKNGRKIAAQWTIGGKCGRGPREHFRNFTPAMRVRPDGTFSRKERFSVRYSDVLVRYRPSFAGRLASDGATGTLRLRTSVYNRRGTKLRTRCDSGTRTWNAAPPPS
jgi:hypothetical protein